MRKFIDVNYHVSKLAIILGMAAFACSPAAAGSSDGIAIKTEHDVQSWVKGTTLSRPQETSARPSVIHLGAADQQAALEAINFALTEVGDGSTFVWRRQVGQLKGIVRPTSSFRDASGRICRHIVFAVAIGDTRKKVEGIACRADNGSWSLSG